ncbi:MAG TPA: glutamate--tRNA ligase [Planctomycetota bacterium]|nr:glutamate--tRNA ligase [Planctomycetota bacterium]
MISPSPRLRFAPSPTGPLHLGGVRTALYNWAAARALGGAFLLRIEDTDQARSSAASLQIILQGLRWLGIDWDEGPEFEGCGGGGFGPYFQMQRLPLYRQAADRLLASGHAYPCYCTSEEIEAGRKELELQKTGFYGYNGRCRHLTAGQRAAFEKQGRKRNLRFLMPEARAMKVHDLVRGEVEVNTKELDDWVMLRPDGVPLYNFACVVDDIGMKITHVVRGEEHFLNGIKQRLLFEALDAPCPFFAHIPLILNKEGKKLSKRDADTNMLDYRDKGFPPEAVFNYIALLGWGFSADRDVFTREEMVAAFRIEGIGKSGARFDEEKLRWMCGEYVRAWSKAECVERARPWLQGVVPEVVFTQHAAWLQNAIACYQERVALLSEFAGKIGWLFGDPAMDEAAKKNLAKEPAAAQWLRDYADVLARSNLPPSFPQDRGKADAAVSLPSKKDAPMPACAFDTPSQIEAACRAFTEGMGVQFGSFVHPVRAALTGTDKGPGLFDAIFLLGKETCVRRLRAAAGP